MASILTILRLLATYYYILCRVNFVGALPVVLAAETSVWKQQRDADIDKSAAPSPTLSKRIFSGVREASRFLRQMVVTSDNTSQNSGRVSTSTLSVASKRTPKEIELCIVGLGRTGSTSIYTALQQLGYSPLHDHERLEIADLLAAKFDDENPMSIDDFATELGRRGFDAILYYGYDFVAWCVQNERKVILTIRDDPKGWAESWLRVVPLLDYLEGKPFIWSKIVQQILPSMRYVCKDVPTAGRPDQYKDLGVLMEGYGKHNARIRSMVPRDLLLEFNVKQGWEALLDFLGKDDVIPNNSFPHVNDRVTMAAVLTIFGILSLCWPLLPLPFVVLLLIALRKLKEFLFGDRSRASTSSSNERVQGNRKISEKDL